MNNQLNITLDYRDDLINDPLAGFYYQYLIIANGFIIAHFVDSASRESYKRMLQKEGFNGFPENIMSTLFKYADPTKRSIRVNRKYVKPEQTGFVPTTHAKVTVPFSCIGNPVYNVEVTIYENLIFDFEVQPYVQYVVTCNDFVIASFTHLIGASAYVAYLRAKGFNNFPSDVRDVMHYYSDPKKRIKNVSKEV